MSITLPLALAALVPVLVGPLPAPSAMLTARLCGGGEITIPLGPDSPDQSDCHPKGCHVGTCRAKGSAERSRRGN